jgi:hypothetical protein
MSTGQPLDHMHTSIPTFNYHVVTAFYVLLFFFRWHERRPQTLRFVTQPFLGSLLGDRVLLRKLFCIGTCVNLLVTYGCASRQPPQSVAVSQRGTMAAVGILQIHLLTVLTICLVERLARLSWSTLVQSNLSPFGLQF